MACDQVVNHVLFFSKKSEKPVEEEIVVEDKTEDVVEVKTEHEELPVKKIKKSSDRVVRRKSFFK